MSFGKETNYDSIAETYIASTDERPFTAYHERPFIIKNLPILKDKKVLDLGCASGYYSQYCLQKGAEVFSVDASEKMVYYTKTRCNNDKKLSTYVHDIAKPMDFIDDQTIDIIICSLVLHYLKDWVDTLNEFHRILKFKGKCFISTHHPINDYIYFNKEDYFEKRLIEDKWKGFKEPIKVKYFVRPLNEYIQPMLQSMLKLKEILEPEPIDELKEINENAYFRLKKHPAFLFFILEKK